MSTERESARETLQAMFCAAVVAQSCDEPSISTNRLVASLLRAGSVQQFCSRTNLDLARLLLAADDPSSASYEDCVLRVKRQLADAGIEFASEAHRASLDLRPLAPAVKRALDPLVEQRGRIAISPLHLLRDLLDSDPELANRLKPLRLDANAITAALASDD